MTKFFYLLMLVIVLSSSCGTQRKIVMLEERLQEMSQSAVETTESKATGDTEEYFEGEGDAYGTSIQKNVLHRVALANAQNIIRQKLSHAYQGVLEDVFEYVGNDTGTDILTKMEAGGKQFMGAIMGDTWEVGSPQFSEKDQKGNVSCKVIARVKRKETMNRVASFLFKDEKIKERVEAEFLQEVLEKHFGQK